MSTSNFEGFVYGTKEQIDDIETKNENKIYIATDIEVATTDYVDEAIANISGTAGYSPTIVVNTETDTEYTLDITDVNGTFETPNLKGSDGVDGTNGTNGVDGQSVITLSITQSDYDELTDDEKNNGTLYMIEGSSSGGGGSGDDGYSPTIIVDTNTDTSYILEITDVNGSYTTPNLKGADGVDGTNGTNGVDGQDGYTPIKGTDYFTQSDIDEIVASVLTQVTDGNEVAY